MDFADPALLADMIFPWQETPVCTLTDGVENLNPQDHSNLMDNMLLDFELPQVIPEPPSSTYPAIATPVAKASWSPLWACDGAPPPLFADILQVVPVSEKVVQFPLVVQKGDTKFDVSSVEAGEPRWPQVASALVTPPAVKQTRRASKREPKSKAKAPSVASVNILVDAKNRAPALAEHILRERLRRDDMAAKYFVLESLLPPASRRERAVVVEDATLLVRALRQKKAQLLKRRAHLKLVEAPNQHSPRSAKRTRPCSQLHESTGLGCIKQQSAVEKNVHEPESSLSSSERAVGLQGTPVNAINVHAGKDDIVVEMVWNRPPPNFESSLLHALETLGSEVTRCSILRVTSGFVHCFINCSKPQVPSQLKLEIQSSEILIMGALTDLLAHSR